jgi:hypothetical protein
MWHFQPKGRGDKIRNPIQGEFFATDAIEAPAQALVRESIQNSLDARLSGEPVTIKITLAANDDALFSEKVADYFRDAWPHYCAAGNGLINAPSYRDRCPFLVIEDFGTRGLTGDPAQADPDPDPSIKNPFCLFFRAEGLSAKSGAELGRWGVGKFVFPRSSRASTHFGLTVRHDDRRRLLLGASTLKAHRIAGDDQMYSPDGLYGRPHHEGFVMPIEDAVEIDRFRETFLVNRTDEPGLSVVVPFVDGDITYEALLQAAVRDYFLPIMEKRLVVELKAGAREVAVDADNLEDILADNLAVLGKSLEAQVGLAKFALRVANGDRLAIDSHDPSRAAKWTDNLVGPTVLTVIRERLDSRVPVAIRVPVTVRKKGRGDLQSYFDVLLVSDPDSDGRPLFIREGIIIADVRGKRAREFRSLVIINDRPLAEMLGDAENPAHTQWQKDSSNFRDRYTYGKALLDYVINSVGELVSIINRSSQEADATLTIDFFSVKTPEEQEEEGDDGRTPKPRPKPGDDKEEPPRDIRSTPSRIKITRVAGGFTVCQGDAPPQTPYVVEIRCAYDVRDGNPLKKWDRADFVLGRSSNPVTCTGAARVSVVRDNIVLLIIEGPEYAAELKGFDVNRDVFVRAEIKEPANAGPAY